MESLINIWNNREKALIVWILIVLVCIVVSKNLRPSFLSVLKALFARKIAPAMLVMLAYISLVVFAAYKLHYWDISLLKDTVIWGLGTAFIMFMHYDKVNTERKYFKKVLLDNVKLVVLLEFIINLYVFNFVVEFLLVPVLFPQCLLFQVRNRNISRPRNYSNLFWLSMAFPSLFLLSSR